MSMNISCYTWRQLLMPEWVLCFVYILQIAEYLNLRVMTPCWDFTVGESYYSMTILKPVWTDNSKLINSLMTSLNILNCTVDACIYNTNVISYYINLSIAELQGLLAIQWSFMCMICEISPWKPYFAVVDSPGRLCLAKQTGFFFVPSKAMRKHEDCVINEPLCIEQ